MTHAAPDLERTIPGLAPLLARERRNRAIGFAQIANPSLTHTVCGVEIRALTPGDRLVLQLLSNAFVAEGLEPLEGDVFTLLWVLSPARARGGLRAFLAERRLRRRVRGLDLERARLEIRRFLAWQLQDRAESSASDGVDYARWIHWASFEAGFWVGIHGGFTLESYLRTPYVVLQQLHRVWRVAHPRIERDAFGELRAEEPQFMNASDGLVSDWVGLQRERFVAAVLAQTTRLP